MRPASGQEGEREEEHISDNASLDLSISFRWD
jgi:hypothetical protein